MVDLYIHAIVHVLESLMSKFMALALPLAIFSGLVLAAIYYRNREETIPKLRQFFPYVFLFVVSAFFWAMLNSTRDIERSNLEWQEMAEATQKPSSDAPDWYQYSPSVVRLVEKTYTRTLTLPPDFAERIGSDGLGVIAPYLSDPTAENVTKLVDSFKRNGMDVLFTREVTRMDEQPIGFQSADISLNFKRKGDTGFEARFNGKYSFSNPDSESRKVRFVFPIAQSGNTVRELSLKVGPDTISEPDDSGNFTWEGEVGAGQTRLAEISFATDGGNLWRYDLGSTRRAVKNLSLTATSDAPVRFPRGTIEPTTHTSNSATWKLSNAVTAQAMSLAFPKDTWQQDGYMQALAILKFTFAFVVVLIIALPLLTKETLSPSSVLMEAIAYGLALLAVPVLFGYLGIAAVFVGPLLGGIGVGAIGGRKWMVPVLMISLIPAAMLSAEHSGLIILVILVALGTLILRQTRSQVS